ncbi:MAG: glycosyltransferase family 2 protein [Nanoarchaeota archaeon]
MKPELSIILPVRNEEKAIASCIKKIKKVLKDNYISAEIIVSDSSSDSSPEIAKKLKVKLIKHDKEGYGNAYLSAFPHALGKYIFMADADGTYDFSEIPRFLKELKKGNDFVIGDRFKGSMEKNSMPLHHKYLGNPILSFILRFLFRAKINDVHCGMRAVKKSSLEKLNLRTTGMEFASEMIIQAIKHKLKIKELPINYSRRIGESKLKSFADGWRHLRFMLLYSPLFLFLLPGAILSILGLLTLIIFYSTNPLILGRQFYVHPIFASSLILIIGYQLMIFALFAKSYALVHLGERSKLIESLHKSITIEKVALPSLFLIIIGLAIFISTLIKWVSSGFGELNEVKSSVLALTLIILGLQTFFSSFMLSILGIKHKD